MSSIERVTIRLPDGFDPAKHEKALLSMIAKRHGEGWEIDSIDPARGMASASRHAAMTEVTANEETDSFDVRLSRGTKPSDGDKQAVKLEDQHAGYYMTNFEPFLGKATLTRLTDDEARCRGAISVALGVKPWDVQVKARRDGGYDLALPRTYQPSKHLTKLEEVATQVVGRDGWYVKVDAQALRGSIIPSEPPTFPEGISFPLNRLGKGHPDRVGFGMILPDPGETKGPELVIDWTAAAFGLVAGTPGAGKSVLLNAIIADSLSNGSELVVVDDMSKAIDFEWCKQYCRPGGWGCDSLEGAVGALGLVIEEGAKRAKVLKQLGINNWLDMPKGKRFTPILVIVDEISALVVPDPVPKGIPKDHPIFIEIAERNLARAMIQSYLRKVLATLRYVGVRAVLSTQATNANTGVDPGMRTLIGHKILQGVNPSKAARSQIFADESAVPHVPDNVKAGGKRAKGVGVATLEGHSPEIYKTYFATTDDYAAALERLGLKKTPSPSPTASQIDRHLPSLTDGRDDEPAARGGRDIERAPSGATAASVAARTGDAYGVALHDGSLGDSAYERANAARHAAAVGAAGPRQTGKQKTEAKEEAAWAARSGEVTTRRLVPDEPPPEAGTTPPGGEFGEPDF